MQRRKDIRPQSLGENFRSMADLRKVGRRKYLLSEAWQHGLALNSPRDVCCGQTDRTEVKMFGHKTQRHVPSMVVVGWWLGSLRSRWAPLESKGWLKLDRATERWHTSKSTTEQRSFWLNSCWTSWKLWGTLGQKSSRTMWGTQNFRHTVINSCYQASISNSWSKWILFFHTLFLHFHLNKWWLIYHLLFIWGCIWF